MKLFDRIKKLSELKGFSSINSFALNGLGYNSSEKINRLKKDNAKPSADIIIDITNKFEDVNIRWLLTGIGNIFLNENEDVSLKHKVSKLKSNELDIIHTAIKYHEEQLMEDDIFKNWYELKKLMIENEIMKAIYFEKKTK